MRNKQRTQRKQLPSFLPHKESSRSSNVSNNYIRWRWFIAPLLFGGGIWRGQLDKMTLRWEPFCIYATNTVRHYVKRTTQWCGWAWERREVSANCAVGAPCLSSPGLLWQLNKRRADGKRRSGWIPKKVRSLLWTLKTPKKFWLCATAFTWVHRNFLYRKHLHFGKQWEYTKLISAFCWCSLMFKVKLPLN